MFFLNPPQLELLHSLLCNINHDILFVQCPPHVCCPTEYVLGTLNIYIHVNFLCFLVWVNLLFNGNVSLHVKEQYIHMLNNI